MGRNDDFLLGERQRKKTGPVRTLVMAATLVACGAGAGSLMLPSIGIGQAGAAAAPKKEAPALIALEPILVTVYGEGGESARMRLGVAVDFGGAEKDDAAKIRLRSAFLASLQGLARSDVQGPGGLETVRSHLMKAGEKTFPDEISEVLITEFIVM